MSDETFPPLRPAIPVRKQEQRVADAERENVQAIIESGRQVDRSLRAKKAWQTRRANATVKSTPLPDRHRPAVFTAQEAVELARLMVDYPFLRRLVE